MNFNYFNMSRSTTIDKLKVQKRELSKLHHPDKESGDEETMRLINEEFDIASKLLTIREKRYKQLIDIEQKAMAGLVFLQPKIEPEIKKVTKETLISIVGSIAPSRFKNSWLKGLEKLSPLIDNADIIKITQNAFGLAKHIVKPQSPKT